MKSLNMPIYRTDIKKKKKENTKRSTTIYDGLDGMKDYWIIKNNLYFLFIFKYFKKTNKIKKNTSFYYKINK